MEYLIPPIWFEGLPWAALLFIGAVALFFLIKGADLLVEGSSGIALRLGISKIIVGATVVSLGTTSPEAAVSVMAAIGGNAGLALGNAVGSVIANTGLIFGIGCLLMALPVERFLLDRQGRVQWGAACLLAICSYTVWVYPHGTDTIGRWIGIGFVIVLGWYMWASVRWGREHTQRERERVSEDPEITDLEGAEILEKAEHDSLLKLIPMFLIGLALIIVFSHILIVCVQEGAAQLGVPEMVIAGTIVAMGTSLPELMVGISAIKKGHASMLIGNVVGANVLNILFVIGVSALATPLRLIDGNAEVPQIFLYLHLPTMLIVLLLFKYYIYDAVRNGKFKRWYGIPLLGIYVTYLVLNMVLAK